ncbi:MAG: hypothetical protein HRT61_02830 [Ekhidna sp.]|nr:hypothetical protein [Ekhidna sp.]
MRTKRFYLSVIAICIVFVGVSTYCTLGGFDEVEVFVMEGKQRTVVGKEYLEKFRYVDFKNRIEEARAQVDSGKLDGMLTVIFFENDTIGIDSAHYFIGSSNDEIVDVLRVPAGYTYREFQTNKTFKIFMTMHELVRPRPEKVAELMKAKAQGEGEELLPVAFELYYPDGSFSVEYWAK